MEGDGARTAMEGDGAMTAMEAWDTQKVVCDDTSVFRENHIFIRVLIYWLTAPGTYAPIPPLLAPSFHRPPLLAPSLHRPPFLAPSSHRPPLVAPSFHRPPLLAPSFLVLLAPPFHPPIALRSCHPPGMEIP